MLKCVYGFLFLLAFVFGPAAMMTGDKTAPAPVPPKVNKTQSAPVATVSMTHVESDSLGTGILRPALGQVRTEEASVTWSEDRWLIGWAPWIGFGHGSVLESHLILFHNGTQLFVRGPHKESPSTMYDSAPPAEFFPSGTGRFVKAGERVHIQFLVLNTGSTPQSIGGQANARVFSVRAQ